METTVKIHSDNDAHGYVSLEISTNKETLKNATAEELRTYVVLRAYLDQMGADIANPEMKSEAMTNFATSSAAHVLMEYIRAGGNKETAFTIVPKFEGSEELLDILMKVGKP